MKTFLRPVNLDLVTSLLIVSCIIIGADAALVDTTPIAQQRNTAEDTPSASTNENDNNNDVGCPRAYSLMIPEAAVKTHTNGDKLIIAHRGASFHLPEHTLAAYRLALEMGADFVEPDLVATQDGHLIALHTADLSVTTNVEEVFGILGGKRRDLQEEVNNATASPTEGANSTTSSQTQQSTQTTTTGRREPWFSPFANRTGYWSFNFTLAEIQTLRVKQRLPRARTTAYDGMFSVPTFLEIQQLVQNWNQERVPQLLLHVDDEDGETDTTTATAAPTTSGNATAHTHYQQTAGVYAELKSTPWFQEDANINMVDLLLQEMDENADIFQSVLNCPGIFKFDEYTIPPLVVQSFEGEALQDLTEKWKAHPSPNIQQAPLPPMILLISQSKCWEESFWFQVGETWRKYVQGVGMDKACFPKVGSADDNVNSVEEGQSAKERAEEFKLVIHTYTERPEHEFLMEGFQNGLEETQYLLCTIGAQAVFSESVHTGIMAARMGCPKTEAAIGGEGEGEDGAIESSNGGKGNPEPSGGSSTSKNLCWESSSEANLYVGLASFTMGAIVVVLLSMWAKRGITGRRPPRQQQVPSEDQDEVSGGMELPPDDELL